MLSPHSAPRNFAAMGFSSGALRNGLAASREVVVPRRSARKARAVRFISWSLVGIKSTSCVAQTQSQSVQRDWGRKERYSGRTDPGAERSANQAREVCPLLDAAIPARAFQ